MIEITNTWVGGFEGAIRGMRNPYESHEKSDSKECSYGDCVECARCDHENDGGWCIGKDDMALCKKLIKGGPEHRKFLRMIHVQADVIAPSYWISELATYKIGTTMNSSSLQHLGAKREYTIRDFSIDDERIYEILAPEPLDKSAREVLVYPDCGEDDWLPYEESGRKYRVFRNGRIVTEAFDLTYANGHKHHYESRELKAQKCTNGYYFVNLGGDKNHRQALVHRLVALTWLKDSYKEGLEVNHKDYNKGNNSVDNLEWVSHLDNVRDSNSKQMRNYTLASAYSVFKKRMKITPEILYAIKKDVEVGMSIVEASKKYGISEGQYHKLKTSTFLSENHELFIRCYLWEKTIDELNRLRMLYNETEDYEYFRAMRQIMPMSFNYHIALDFNYECLLSIYHQRHAHRLCEWHRFSDWIESLPYMQKFLEAMK